MKRKLLGFWLLLLIGLSGAEAQAPRAALRGIVTDAATQMPLPGATVYVVDNEQGTTTDADGRFVLTALPSNRLRIRISFVGYDIQTRVIDLTRDTLLTIALRPGALQTAEVVVSANRYQVTRQEAVLPVGVLSPRLMERTQSLTLAEGLRFQPGLRIENNCQNCGFTQIRMNGLEGPYSQVLINSRPIFSALVGVYGLEMIPRNMIERVEVVRGGGSALYGANAVAGTINIITREPVANEVGAETYFGLIDGRTPDRMFNVNTSLVADDLRSGLTLFGSVRQRQPHDANDDDFSEITQLRNLTLGGRAFYKVGARGRLQLDFHTIRDFRRGGNAFDRPAHLTDVTEQLDHQIHGGGLQYDWFSPDARHKWSAYVTAQHTRRDSYYGGGGNEDNPELYPDDLSPEDRLAQLAEAASFYGQTEDLALVGGVQWLGTWTPQLTLTLGTEALHNTVDDQMPGYDRRIDQAVSSLGTYGQLEWRPLTRLTLLGGLRYDYTQVTGLYQLLGNDFENDAAFAALNPRLNARYQLAEAWVLRGGYARGFRPPQAFDEDLHIETVGGAAQFVRLSPDLRPEFSDAFTLSAEWQRPNRPYRLLAEAFYTRLNDPFNLVGETSGTDTAPEVVVRVNADTPLRVVGVNLEGEWALGRKWRGQAGVTLQRAAFDSPVALYEPDPEAPGDDTPLIEEARVLRTPNHYGYFNVDWLPLAGLTASLSGIYSGTMRLPYEGNTGPIELRDTPSFWDMNIRLAYEFRLGKGIRMEVNGGVRNFLNQFQDDFDRGFDRDAGYIYGPLLPITYFTGLRLLH